MGTTTDVKTEGKTGVKDESKSENDGKEDNVAVEPKRCVTTQLLSIKSRVKAYMNKGIIFKFSITAQINIHKKLFKCE